MTRGLSKAKIMLNFEANKMSDMPDLMPGGELALDKRTAAPLHRAALGRYMWILHRVAFGGVDAGALSQEDGSG